MIQTLSVTLLASSALISTLAMKHDPLLIWNASASAPIGLYAVQPPGKLGVTDLVVARPPESLTSWLAERGYLPKGATLIKRVAGLPGQKICRDGFALTIDGIPMAEALERDHAGRPLPQWRGCFVLHPGEIFLLNWDAPASLDGRYFGALPVSAVIGRAAPLWTVEDAQ
jgi:conjugative transfer signal peptidase TraF